MSHQFCHDLVWKSTTSMKAQASLWIQGTKVNGVSLLASNMEPLMSNWYQPLKLYEVELLHLTLPSQQMPILAFITTLLVPTCLGIWGEIVMTNTFSGPKLHAYVIQPSFHGLFMATSMPHFWHQNHHPHLSLSLPLALLTHTFLTWQME